MSDFTIQPGMTARDVAYNIIRDKIIFLDLKPGEALSDKMLAEELGMSRTPVREAIIILSVAKMVVVKPQAGTFVAPIDLERVETEQFSRIAMEKEVIQRACHSITPALALEYEKNNAEFFKYENAEDPARIKKLMELDNQFHSIAFTAAGRGKNFTHMSNYMQHIERLRALSVTEHKHNELSSDHTEISRAVINGDNISAMYWLDKHLNRYIDSMENVRKRYPEYFELG